jgi:Tol biopolymer transport system component/DNA-binding winged helix-turn-helix (wHTH) protein
MAKKVLSGRIRFGDFEVDLASRELFKYGKKVPLANQSFVALAVLLERPGQVVSREELRQHIWPDNRVVEFEQGLNAVINRLREALGNAPGEASVIETLPRRGYRFIGTLDGGQINQPQKRLVVYGLAIIFVLLSLAAMLLTRNDRSRDSSWKVEPLTSLVGREVSPSFTPDGASLLFAWNGDADAQGRFDLYTKHMGSEQMRRLTRNPATALRAAWAPGGAHLAVARRNTLGSGIYVVEPTEGLERLLASANFLDEAFMQLSWSPDGRQIAYAAVESDGWSHINIVSTSGSKVQPLLRPAGCLDAGEPAFSQNGRRLAFVCTSSFGVYDVFVGDLPTGEARSLVSLEGTPQGLAWTAPGDALVLANEAGSDSGIWRVTLEGKTMRLMRAEGPLGAGLSLAAGRIAFVRENPVIDIWRADLTAPSMPSDTSISSSRTELVPEYSPDATHIAFESTRSGNPEIWLADAEGQNPVKLTALNGALTGAPSWCVDGRRIAFDSRASGTSAVYVLDILGGQAHRLDSSVDNLALPVWSQDCRWIFASNGRSALYRVPASGGAAERFTEKRAYRALVSGSRVVFNVNQEGGVVLWSKPAEGGDESPLEGMPSLRYSDGWTATPLGIYFITADAQQPIVNFYDFASHHTRVVRTLDGAPAALGGLGVSVSKDGHWLLYTRAEKSEADIMMISGT